MRPSVLVTFAVEEEARPFRRRNVAGSQIRVTGMGEANALAATRRALAEGRPAMVLTCGFAGGLNPGWARGQVIYDADAGSGWGGWLSAAGAQSGRFVGVDRVLITPAEKRAMRENTGADAADMESAAVRAICRSEGVPSATVRVISDAADEALPLDFNRLMTSAMKVDAARLALELVRSPSKVPALVAFRRRLREAAERLADVLAWSLTSAARSR